MALSDDVAKLVFVENLDSSHHSLATQFQVAHPDCTLQDIIQYLRMVNVDARTRGQVPMQQVEKPGKGPAPMDVDLKSLAVQLAAIERRLDASTSGSASLTRLTAEERRECMENELCFNCQQPGHQAKNCPQAKNKGKRKGGQQKR